MRALAISPGFLIESEREFVPPPLNNTLEAQQELQTEKPEHRIMLYMRAGGLSPRQIANATGYCYASVIDLFRQPWAKKLMVELIEAKGGAIVENYLQVHAIEAAEKIIDIMRDTNVSPAIQQKSAFKLIDKVVSDKLDVIRTQTLPPAQVDQQLQVVEEQIKEIEDGIRSRKPTSGAEGQEVENGQAEARLAQAE